MADQMMDVLLQSLLDSSVYQLHNIRTDSSQHTQNLSTDDCLEANREDYHDCSVPFVY